METENLNEHVQWGETYVAIKRRSILIISLILLVGYIMETPVSYAKGGVNVLNIVAAVFTLITGILFFLKLIRQPLTSFIVHYSLVLNLLLSYLVYHGPNLYSDADAIRSLLIMSIIIPIAGFLTGRLHALVIGGLTLGYFTLILLQGSHPYLQSNAVMMYLIIICYPIGIYYLLTVLERATVGMTRLIGQLSDKNTELKEKHDQLSQHKQLIEQQKDELKAAIDSRDIMFSVISHDLKNPLFAILSFCDLIEDRINKVEKEKILEYAKAIQLSAFSLNRLLANLLDWTRFQTGKMRVFAEWIHVDGQVESAMSVSRNMAAQKEISLVHQGMPGIKLFADRNMFDTLTRNFLSNAIKYTPNGGRVSIETRIDNNLFFLVVEDTGTGMSNSDIQRIMQPGIQKPEAGTGGEYGTGIGLELCKKFIQLHDGTLQIQSEPAKGTRITVILPSTYRQS